MSQRAQKRVSTGSCAAGLGTTIPVTVVRPFATTTHRPLGTATLVSVLRGLRNTLLYYSITLFSFSLYTSCIHRAKHDHGFFFRILTSHLQKSESYTKLYMITP